MHFLVLKMHVMRAPAISHVSVGGVGCLPSPWLLWVGGSPLTESLRASLQVAQTHWDNEWGIHDDACKASMISNHLRWFAGAKMLSASLCALHSSRIGAKKKAQHEGWALICLEKTEAYWRLLGAFSLNPFDM